MRIEIRVMTKKNAFKSADILFWLTQITGHLFTSHRGARYQG